MRIIAGRFKGRRLKTPTWEGLRPTSDKVRETLFNILGNRTTGARVLDGYAGTGAVGLEALSRGAAHVVFVEQARDAIALIEANLAVCDVDGGYTIERRDLLSVLRRRPTTSAFDVMVLDPPYDITNMRDVLASAAPWLRPEGVLVLERATRRPPEVPSSLSLLRDVRSGDTTLTLLSSARDAGGPPERP